MLKTPHARAVSVATFASSDTLRPAFHKRNKQVIKQIARAHHWKWGRPRMLETPRARSAWPCERRRSHSLTAWSLPLETKCRPSPFGSKDVTPSACQNTAGRHAGYLAWKLARAGLIKFLVFFLSSLPVMHIAGRMSVACPAEYSKAPSLCYTLSVEPAPIQRCMLRTQVPNKDADGDASRRLRCPSVPQLQHQARQASPMWSSSSIFRNFECSSTPRGTQFEATLAALCYRQSRGLRVAPHTAGPAGRLGILGFSEESSN